MVWRWWHKRHRSSEFTYSASSTACPHSTFQSSLPLLYQVFLCRYRMFRHACQKHTLLRYKLIILHNPINLIEVIWNLARHFHAWGTIRSSVGTRSNSSFFFGHFICIPNTESVLCSINCLHKHQPHARDTDKSWILATKACPVTVEMFPTPE